MPKTVPADFPRDQLLGAVPGAQLKFLARKIGDKYVVGLTDEELLERYEICLDLVNQLVQYCRRKQVARPESTQIFILERIYNGVSSEVWDFSLGEVMWVVNQVESGLGWHQ